MIISAIHRDTVRVGTTRRMGWITVFTSTTEPAQVAPTRVGGHANTMHTRRFTMRRAGQTIAKIPAPTRADWLIAGRLQFHAAGGGRGTM